MRKVEGKAGKLNMEAFNGLTTSGIQTMLRLSSANNVKLSGMADGKANILLSINAIIILIIVSVLGSKLSEDPHLRLPAFLTSSVATTVLSILATRPEISRGIFSETELMTQKTNILFFGNFHKMSADEYENGMRKLMGDSDCLYSSLVKDIYALGVVLGRKYKLLRIAYNVFMFGIITSVISFGIAGYLHFQQTQLH